MKSNVELNAENWGKDLNINSYYYTASCFGESRLTENLSLKYKNSVSEPLMA